MFTEVIPTERATSPPERYVMTLLAVPPGHAPTRMTPASSAVSNPNKVPSPKARSGITVN